MDKFLVEEGNFSWRGSWISWYYLKNDQQLKKKQVFQLKVRSNIKTLNEQKHYVYEKGCVSLISLFYAKISWSTFKILLF